MEQSSLILASAKLSRSHRVLFLSPAVLDLLFRIRVPDVSKPCKAGGLYSEKGSGLASVQCGGWPRLPSIIWKNLGDFSFLALPLGPLRGGARNLNFMQTLGDPCVLITGM